MKCLRRIFIKLAECTQSSYKAKYRKDLPEIFGKRTVYIIGEKENPWLIAFECPCGCKKTIQLNILKEARPRWKFQVLSNNKIDISPSVRRTSGCKSHFFLRKGKIYWC